MPHSLPNCNRVPCLLSYAGLAFTLEGPSCHSVDALLPCSPLRDFSFAVRTASDVLVRPALLVCLWRLHMRHIAAACVTLSLLKVAGATQRWGRFSAGVCRGLARLKPASLCQQTEHGRSSARKLCLLLARLAHLVTSRLSRYGCSHRCNPFGVGCVGLGWDRQPPPPGANVCLAASGLLPQIRLYLQQAGRGACLADPRTPPRLTQGPPPVSRAGAAPPADLQQAAGPRPPDCSTVLTDEWDLEEIGSKGCGFAYRERDR